MKIGLLTLPVGLGYGGIMQAFALKTVLTQLGHEVILIRRIGKKHKLKRIIRRTIKKYVFGKKKCRNALYVPKMLYLCTVKTKR